MEMQQKEAVNIYFLCVVRALFCGTVREKSFCVYINLNLTPRAFLLGYTSKDNWNVFSYFFFMRCFRPQIIPKKFKK